MGELTRGFGAGITANADLAKRLAALQAGTIQKADLFPEEEAEVKSLAKQLMGMQGLASDEKELVAGNWYYDRAKEMYSNRLMKIGKESALSGRPGAPPTEDDELRALTGLMR